MSSSSLEVIRKRSNIYISQKLTEISHVDRSTINMEHFKHEFRSKACTQPPGWTKRVESKGQKSTFSEQGNVTYQMKGNLKCGNMEAFILPADSPSRPLGRGQKVKIKLNQNMVMLQIKLKGITRAATR